MRRWGRRTPRSLQRIRSAGRPAPSCRAASDRAEARLPRMVPHVCSRTSRASPSAITACMSQFRNAWRRPTETRTRMRESRPGPARSLRGSQHPRRHTTAANWHPALGQPAPRRCSPCGAARRLRLAPRRKARTPRRWGRLARGRPWGALGLGAATAAPTPPATGRPGQRCLPRPKPKPAGSLRPGPWARPGPTGSARGLQPEPLALQRPNWRPRGGRGPRRGWRLPQARAPAAGSAVVAACR